MTRTKPTEAIEPLTLLIGPGLRPREVAIVLALLARTRSGRSPWSSTVEQERAQDPRGLELADLGQLLAWDLERVTWSSIRISLESSEPDLEPSGAQLGENFDMRGGQGRELASPEGLDGPKGSFQVGILLLDADLVPTEDIGIVRRFLESHPHWTLLLLGAGPSDHKVQLPGSLPRGSALAWPPDLEQLARIVTSAVDPVGEPEVASHEPQRENHASEQVGLGNSPKPASATPFSPAPHAPEVAQVEPREDSPLEEAAEQAVEDADAETGARADLSPQAANPFSPQPEAPEFQFSKEEATTDQKPSMSDANSTSFLPPGLVFTELGGLVEELLAGDALTQSDSPRYLFRSEGLYPVIGDRQDLASSLGGLLGLARHAAGARGVVSVLVGPLADGHGVLLRVDFPPGQLGDSGVEELLQRAADGPQDPKDLFGRALGDAARAAAQLRGTGAEPSLSGLEDGRLRLAVEFPPLPDHLGASPSQELNPDRATPSGRDEWESSAEAGSRGASPGGDS